MKNISLVVLVNESLPLYGSGKKLLNSYLR